MNKSKNILPNTPYHDLLKQVLRANGADAEIDVAIEEMSELTKALLKHRRATNFGTQPCNSYLDSNATKQDIYEEIADVIIMLSQLVIIFNCEDEIHKQLETKIAKLEKNLESSALQSVHIADLGLSTRVYNALIRADINNLDKLAKQNLKQVRNLGEKGISEIKNSLANFIRQMGGE